MIFKSNILLTLKKKKYDPHILYTTGWVSILEVLQKNISTALRHSCLHSISLCMIKGMFFSFNFYQRLEKLKELQTQTYPFSVLAACPRVNIRTII